MKDWRSIVNEKTVFFNLNTRKQMSLRIFLGLGSLFNILAFLFLPSESSLICPTLGILLNTLIIFFAFQIKLAPNYLFQLIPWAPAVFLLFNGREVFVAIGNRDFLTTYNLINTAIVLVTLVFLPTIFIYVKETLKAKKAGSSNLNPS
jgi:hypothetical protein